MITELYSNSPKRCSISRPDHCIISIVFKKNPKDYIKTVSKAMCYDVTEDLSCFPFQLLPKRKVWIITMLSANNKKSQIHTLPKFDGICPESLFAPSRSLDKREENCSSTHKPSAMLNLK